MNIVTGPTLYQFPNQFAPNPVTAAETKWDFEITVGQNPTTDPNEGQIFQCSRSGRQWVYRTSPNQFVQLLPYVRTNDGATAVQMVYDAGNLKVQNPTGATGGDFNAFGQLKTNASGIFMPMNAGAASGNLITDMATGQVLSVVPSVKTIATDWTITNTASPTVLTDLSYGPVATIQKVDVSLTATVYHNNGFEISFAVQYYLSATEFVPLATTTVSSQNGGFINLSMNTHYSMELNSRLRILCWPNTSGVQVRAFPAVTFPTSAGYFDNSRATFAVYRRIA